MKARILSVFGTRPEAIKMAPVVHALKQHPEDFESRVCVTAQHREMLDQALELFGIVPDYDLDLMQKNQSLADLTKAILSGFEGVLREFRPHCVLVHGDTTTTFAATLASFYQGADVGHVEAGLRTGNLLAPWPEEANRRLTSVLTKFHFAPTQKAKENLLSEGFPESSIIVTGNTVVDALLTTVRRFEQDKALEALVAAKFDFLDRTKRLILVTGHRRESFGEGLESLCNSLRQIVVEYDDVQIVYPVHLNPNVRGPVHRILSDLDRIFLIDPQEYLEFVYLMSICDLIITDSGGIQEEAPSLGKPVLVTRDATERPEAIAAGALTLVGTKPDIILREVRRVLDGEACTRQDPVSNPYGDGFAADRIVAALKSTLLGPHHKGPN
jgi:UDP-N-acetylglucosamine 2-epimerase (non-hydrolysing)